MEVKSGLLGVPTSGSSYLLVRTPLKFLSTQLCGNARPNLPISWLALLSLSPSTSPCTVLTLTFSPEISKSKSKVTWEHPIGQHILPPDWLKFYPISQLTDLKIKIKIIGEPLCSLPIGQPILPPKLSSQGTP